MFFEKNNGYSYSPNILISPLDWGLGHATRCIPIIYSLVNNGATVFLAADGPVASLLEKEFPQVKILPLRGYRVRYSKHDQLFIAKLVLQMPRFLYTVYSENKWLKQALKIHNFDAVISDNRPGLFARSVPCVYITHQLSVKTKNRFTQWIAQKIHYFFINKFSQCWVPDNKGNDNLGGALSHTAVMPVIPVRYVGILSRFIKKETEKKYDLLFLISGPEPQREVFEKLLLDQAREYNGKILVVRGLPKDNCSSKPENTNIEMVNHLNGEALSLAIQQSRLVICRSGYTSVMDLMALQQRAVLVPTPGQTEQEYLADYLYEKGLFFSTTQREFSLIDAVKNAATFAYRFNLPVNNDYESAVKMLLEKIPGN